MMENAGRSLASLARDRFLGGDPRGKRVVVLAGTGGNGGGSMVCARHLANWGANVAVFVTRPAASFSKVPAHQLDILQHLGLPIATSDGINTTVDVDLIVDGIIGYRLMGAPAGSAADMVGWANQCDAPTLALDVPSGVDTSSGRALRPAIMAAATMTLALPKQGLRPRAVGRYVGELYLADIGVPPKLYSSPGLEIAVGPIFARRGILHLS